MGRMLRELGRSCGSARWRQAVRCPYPARSPAERGRCAVARHVDTFVMASRRAQQFVRVAAHGRPGEWRTFVGELLAGLA